MPNVSVYRAPPPLLTLPTELREHIVALLPSLQDQFCAEQVLWQDSRDVDGAWVGNPSMWNRAFLRALDRPQQLAGLALKVSHTSSRANRHVLSCGLDWDCLTTWHTQAHISHHARKVCDALAPKSPLTLQFKSLIGDIQLVKNFGRWRGDHDELRKGVVLKPNRCVAPNYRLFQDPLVQSTYITQQNARCDGANAPHSASMKQQFGTLHLFDRGLDQSLHRRRA